MWCTSCALAVEGVLAHRQGIERISVHYPSATLWVRGSAKSISLEALAPKVKRLGYRLTELEAHADAHARLEQESRYLSLRLLVGSVFGMWTMLASILIYAGALPNPTIEWVVAWVSGAFSIPVITFAGWPFYRAGLRTLRAKRPGMDVLVALGVWSAVGVSVGLLWRGSAEVYFDTAVMLIVLLLGGRLVETLCRHRGLKALDVLPQPSDEAMVWEDTQWRFKSLTDVQPGARAMLSPGELISLDGVLEEAAWVDTASLTGESTPRHFPKGEPVYAGCRLLGSADVVIRVTHALGQRRLDRLRDQMRHYQTQKGELQKLADRFAAWLSPVALILGVATLPVGLVMGLGIEDAIVRALSVLVVACPCAVGLAVPLASLAGSGQLLNQGIALRDPAALETLARVKAIALDKTGTLTQGEPLLVNWASREGITEQALKATLYQVAANSQHPLSKTLKRWARSDQSPAMPEVSAPLCVVQDVPGQGVHLRLSEYGDIWLGSQRFLNSQGIEPPANRTDTSFQAASEVMLADAQGWLGSFYLEDTPYEDAAPSIQLLQADYWVVMLSGDRPSAVEAAAERIGLAPDACFAERSPEAKARLVQGLPSPTMFVGDGVNDTLSLAAADIGVAPFNASDAAQEGAAAHLLKPGIASLVEGLAIARATRRVMLQNLTLSAVYNTLALGLVIIMAIPPLVAVLAMVASSLSVTLNAARLAWRD
ncbi:cation-translocating P-type ATPase [Vreelandella nanhaiensis]|uniref:Cation-translocating P-type ATPase n=2 Tax=Vreelandella nanhaiensis TaxID=1258546 RepID=A0A433KMF8_9GAMM|nr:cation-translocating P-type ATPase [Halomonas nanhaiensis]